MTIAVSVRIATKGGTMSGTTTERSVGDPDAGIDAIENGAFSSRVRSLVVTVRIELDIGKLAQVVFRIPVDLNDSIFFNILDVWVLESVKLVSWPLLILGLLTFRTWSRAAPSSLAAKALITGAKCEF